MQFCTVLFLFCVLNLKQLVAEMRFYNGQRAKRALARLPYTLNALMIALGVFILFALAIIWIVFEEFTAFTDYTQQWIEFNFFIHYWDKLTIARVYLSFITIYGGVLVASNLPILTSFLDLE